MIGVEFERPAVEALAPEAVRPEISKHLNTLASKHFIDPASLAQTDVIYRFHHHLVREGLRTTAGLVVETGSAREVHHFAVLAGYGAEAIHPYLAMETLASLHGAKGGEAAELARELQLATGGQLLAPPLPQQQQRQAHHLHQF